MPSVKNTYTKTKKFFGKIDYSILSD